MLRVPTAPTLPAGPLGPGFNVAPAFTVTAPTRPTPPNTVPLLFTVTPLGAALNAKGALDADTRANDRLLLPSTLKLVVPTRFTLIVARFPVVFVMLPPLPIVSVWDEAFGITVLRRRRYCLRFVSRRSSRCKPPRHQFLPKSAHYP